MIKILATVKVDGKRRTKQFSSIKNRLINIYELEKMEHWITNAVNKGHVVELSYNIKFDSIAYKYNFVTELSGKTFVRNENMVKNTLVRSVNEVNKHISQRM